MHASRNPGTTGHLQEPSRYPPFGSDWSGGKNPERLPPESFFPDQERPPTRSGRLPAWEWPPAEAGSVPARDAPPGQQNAHPMPGPSGGISWAEAPISHAELSRSTGLGLKVRFLIAIALLSIVPAFTLVLVFQNASRAAVETAGTQRLATAASAQAAALNQQLVQLQGTVAHLAESPAPGQTATADALLVGASQASPGSFAWMMLDGSDSITASAPALLEGQSLAHLSILRQPAALEAAVQTLRKPAPTQAGVQPFAIGFDPAVPGNVWLAIATWLPPHDQTHQSSLLALFSLAALFPPVLEHALGNTGVALLLDQTGTVLSVQGEPALARQVGQPIPIEALKHLAQAPNASASLVHYLDPATHREFVALGVPCGLTGWACLVAAAAEVITPSPTGLLSPQNTLLEFLFLLVAIVLLITGIAFPVVRPIRKATRQIAIAAASIRILKGDVQLLGQDQEMVTHALGQAARGALARSASQGRQIATAWQFLRRAAEKLVTLAYLVAEIPRSTPGRATGEHREHDLAERFRQQITEIWSDLEGAHQLVVATLYTLNQNASPDQLEHIRTAVEAMNLSAQATHEQLQRAFERLQQVEQIVDDLASGR